MGGEYKEYLPQDGHYVWQSTKRRHWIGPTKAEISLVWLIGRGNTNRPSDGYEETDCYIRVVDGVVDDSCVVRA